MATNSNLLMALRFAYLSLVLTLAAGLGLAALAQHLVMKQVDAIAIDLNEDITRVMRNTLWPEFAEPVRTSYGKSGAELQSGIDFDHLFQATARAIKDSDVVKVKVYNTEGFTVFSTDRSQIGEGKGSGEGVRQAINGTPTGGLTERGGFDAIHGHIVDVALYYRYMPIRVDTRVVGVFEIYQNVTKMKSLADRALQSILLTLFVVLGALYLLQFLLVRWLGRQLEAKEALLHEKNARLTQALSEAEAANRIKSEFLSTVSHELRTPLTAVVGTLGLLDGNAVGEIPPAAKSMVGIANKNAKRLGELINDLLDMDKLVAGKFQYDCAGQQLMPLVEQALEANQSIAQGSQIRYVLTERVDGVQVMVDGRRIMQVLANFLSNAVKYSPVGAAIEVAVTQRPGAVRVSVRDHGDGIPQALHSRVFQRFWQADSSDARKRGGTGLGLAICRELVEGMHGQIGFESTGGEGACFHFDLPVWSPDAATSGSPLESPERAKHILVVEDDADVAAFLSLILTRAGYTVDVAVTGAEALEKSRQCNYAAMTLDCVLPDMNGSQVIEHLREQPALARLPIVVVAANPDAVRQSMQGDLSHIDWLAKPIDQSGLLSTLVRMTSPAGAHQPRVLHVEDDAEMHQAVRSMTGDRFDFELATTLREARARVSLERFDVVILDLTLPNESGWDLLPDIRSRQPDARVVVLSESELSPDQTRQVDVVLRKSQVLPGQLMSAIDVRETTAPKEETAT